MSENETKLNEVRREYAKMCQLVGDLSYRINAFQMEIGDMTVKMRNANLDADKLVKEIEKEKQSEPKAELT